QVLGSTGSWFDFRWKKPDLCGRRLCNGAPNGGFERSVGPDESGSERFLQRNWLWMKLLLELNVTNEALMSFPSILVLWEQKCLNSELWHACAGPLVCLPAIGSRVVYFPQGHSEQADAETDEVYAQMTLQPLSLVTGIFYTVLGARVGWDESTAGERQPRVSLWEIEPLTTFPMYPSAFPLRLKRPWPSGLPSLHGMHCGKDDDIGLNSSLMWLRDGERGIQSLNFQGYGMTPWIHQRCNSSILGLQPDMYQAMASAALQEMRAVYKSGSFGRSLDITKFNSYPELRCELGRLFGLEGLLEDPLRSGWQLVFVDRENDVLLVGDDPWQ
ncbi:hypothetical protein BHM03_00047439, partial [Ensete ventricosum]